MPRINQKTLRTLSNDDLDRSLDLDWKDRLEVAS